MKKILVISFFSWAWFNIQAQIGNSDTTIITDTSIIKESVLWYTNVHTKGKEISSKGSIEYFTGKNLRRHLFYFREDTSIVQMEYYRDTTGNNVGQLRMFNPDGNLRYTVDYATNSWIPNNLKEYPYYELLCNMKVTADSILTKLFSKDFVANHLKWNMFESNYFSKHYHSEPSFVLSWLNTKPDFEKYKPTEFHVIYDILIDGNSTGLKIKMLLDTKGDILTSHLWNVSSTVYNAGLENLGASKNRDFTLTPNEAQEKAKEFGLIETDSTKAMSYLKFDKDSTNQIFKGQYRIHVVQKRKYEKVPSQNPNDYDEFIYYTSWTFNPWTGEFIERKNYHTLIHNYQDTYRYEDFIED